MTEAPIAIAVFEELQDTAGAEFVGELVDTFLEEAPPMLDELRSAHAARHAERYRRAAHSLKSNGLTFGALALGALARKLELEGPDAPCAAADVAALAQEYARAAAALKALRHG
jgi:HPt (histidine-containing phosphotransfer) domain-containing protein